MERNRTSRESRMSKNTACGKLQIVLSPCRVARVWGIRKEHRKEAVTAEEQVSLITLKTQSIRMAYFLLPPFLLFVTGLPCWPDFMS